MDWYLPSKDKRPSPMVINIQGGGWNYDVKNCKPVLILSLKKNLQLLTLNTGNSTRCYKKYKMCIDLCNKKCKNNL